MRYVCASLHVCRFVLHVISHLHKSWHHANTSNHLCIIVTEPSESEPIEPAEVAEPEYVVEPEENQGKQLCIIPCTYLICFNFSYLNWVFMGLCILCYYCIFGTYLYASPVLVYCLSLPMTLVVD